jgi:hypothetical protein
VVDGEGLVANPAYPAGAFFKHQIVVPVQLERHRKQAKKKSALDRCYEKVDDRDGEVCQVTGVPLKAGHLDPKRRLTRDHLKPRSTGPEDRAHHDNVLTVSDFIHSLLQSSALYPVDRHGEETVRVSKIVGWRWRESFGKCPIRLPKDKAA